MKSLLYTGVLALLAGTAAAAESTRFNLILEGALPQATQVQVDVVGDTGKLRQTVPLVGGKLLQGIASPAGKSTKLTLSSIDASGLKLFQGTFTLANGAGFDTPATITLKSALDGSIATVNVAAQRVVMEFSTVVRKDQTLTRITANVFDADGRLVPVKDGDLQWNFDDPWPRENLKPCPDSDYRAPLCSEFLPIRKDQLITISSCWRKHICRIEFVPPIAPVWRKVAIGQGGHACALKLDGRISCWGEGEQGQLGFVAAKACTSSGSGGTTYGCSWNPQPVQCASGPCQFNDVSVGSKHTCAIDLNQDAWCWGNNTQGELGLATYNDAKDPGVATPGAVVGGRKFLSIHAGFSTTCGVTVTHEVFCWGANAAAIVPDTADRWTNAPRRVTLPGPVASADNAFSHACALLGNATSDLYCWGSNQQTEMGNGAITPAPTCSICSATPLRMQDRVPALTGKVVSLATTGAMGNCATTTDNQTTCWGRAIPAFPYVRPNDKLSRGFLHYCVLANGNLSCAGLGALGDGNDYSSAAGPVSVASPTFFRDVDTGNYASCALGRDEKVYCWGNTLFGITGLGAQSGIVLKPAALSIP